MKKLFSILLVLFMVVSLTGCGSSSSNKLVVYNWGEYANMDVIEAFEEEFNCEVVYETFDSNEMMYTKLMSGNNYDVLVPSDYMIEKMITEDLLLPIDKEIITNLDLLSEDVLGLSYDTDNTYSVPYFVGNVGILYDTTKVSEADLTEGWDLLLNSEYEGQIYMYDSQRDSFMVALKALGYSMNTTDEAEINEAYEWLVNQNETMSPIYVGDEVIDNMMNSMMAMAVVYSGDAAAVIAENPDMDFFIPAEGSNTWSDSFVISKDSENSELANEFINYMISNENAYLNEEEVGYYSANEYAATEGATSIYADNNAFNYVQSEKDEVFAYQDTEIIDLYSELWTKVKAQ